MERVTSCTVCLDRFNGEAQLPTVLLCGHTLCRQCVSNLYERSWNLQITCPICRQVTRSAPADLPVNFSILALLENVQRDTEPKKHVAKWCLDCKKVADPTCCEEHTICPLRKERARQMGDAKPILEAAVECQRSLEWLLESHMEAFEDQLSLTLHSVRDCRSDTEEALHLLETSPDATDADWERAAATVEQARRRCILSQDVDRQSVNFIQSASRCEVTVDGDNGRTWRGTCNLKGSSPDANSMIAGLAFVSAMQRAGMLALVAGKDDEAVDPTAGSCQESQAETEEQEQEQSPEHLVHLDDSEFVPLPGGQHVQTDYGHGEDARSLIAPLDPPMTSLTVWHTHCYPLHVERILSCHGPTLEQLHLCDVTTEVLAPIFSMKRLRTLELRGAKSPLQDFLSYRSPTNNALRLNTLTVTGFWWDVHEGVPAIVGIFGGAQHLVLEIPVSQPVNRLAGALRVCLERSACSPRSIKIVRGADGCLRHERCQAQCMAMRRAVLGHVHVWCEVHEPSHIRSTAD